MKEPRTTGDLIRQQMEKQATTSQQKPLSQEEHDILALDARQEEIDQEIMRDMEDYEYVKALQCLHMKHIHSGVLCCMYYNRKDKHVRQHSKHMYQWASNYVAS